MGERSLLDSVTDPQNTKQLRDAADGEMVGRRKRGAGQPKQTARAMVNQVPVNGYQFSLDV